MVQHEVFRYPVADGHLRPFEEQMAIGIEPDSKAYQVTFLNHLSDGSWVYVRCIGRYGKLSKVYLRKSVKVRYL